MDILVAVAALITLVVPVLAESLRYKDGPRKGRLNIWGAAFVVAALATFIGAMWSLRETNLRSTEATRNFQAILSKVETESLRLNPYDFQIRLVSDLSKPTFDVGTLTQPRTRGFATLGNAHLSFDLVQASDPQHVPPGRGGGGFIRYRYVASNVTIIGLEEYPYVTSLDGKTLRIELPMKALQFSGGGWKHTVDLYIKGRFFAGTADDSGVVQIPLVLQGKF